MITLAPLDRLHKLEAVIESNLLGFVAVGTALMEIRDRKLYQGEENPDTGEAYRTFGEYMRQRWQPSMRHLYYQMDATVIREQIQENCTTVQFLPSHEWSIRPLTELATPKQVELGNADPDLWAKAWERAECLAAGKEPTEKHTKQAVNEIIKRGKVAGLPRAPKWTGKWKLDAIYEADVTTDEWLKSMPEGRVDFVITDPPYFPDDDGTYSLYETAGRLAKHVLKPGGFCAVYLGKLDLPVLFHILTQHLDYEWTTAVYRPDGGWDFRKTQFKECWRPIGIWRKPGTRVETVYAPDAWLSKRAEKDAHEWQQEIGPVKALIEKYTAPGQLVLDPYCGGGTKPLAAKLLGRHYLSFDKDPDAVRAATERIRSNSERTH